MTNTETPTPPGATRAEQLHECMTCHEHKPLHMFPIRKATGTRNSRSCKPCLAALTRSTRAIIASDDNSRLAREKRWQAQVRGEAARRRRIAKAAPPLMELMERLREKGAEARAERATQKVAKEAKRPATL